MNKRSGSSRKDGLTAGPITKNMLLFALPLMCGNLLQQMYNLADTWVVGRFLGADALAAVGSSYTLMVFLTSILLGLCMGSGAAVSMDYGSGAAREMRRSVFLSFLLIASASIVLNVLAYVFLDPILCLLQVPPEVLPLMKTYLRIIFAGIFAVFLYNYYACLLRAVGNSVMPLVFLAVSSVLNVGLDLFFVIVLKWGVAGAASATVTAQYVSGLGLACYTLGCFPSLRPKKEDCRCSRFSLGRILNLSLMTCLQQSIMNFGILMIQGLVISLLVVLFAEPLMSLFIDPAETAIIAAGVTYLRIEGSCYIGIGILFLLYGYYRAINRPLMSVILTIASLGTRVALAYGLASLPAVGVTGIWAAIPIGWALADIIGIWFYFRTRSAVCAEAR